MLIFTSTSSSMAEVIISIVWILALNCVNIFSCAEDGAIMKTNTSLWKYIQQLKSHRNFLWFAAMNIIQVSPTNYSHLMN